MINDYSPVLSTVDIFYVLQENLQEADSLKVQLTARKFEFHFLKCHWNKAYLHC